MNVDLHEKVERAKTLPSQLYFDAATLEQERQKISHRTWQPVGKIAQLPEVGSYLTAEVAGEPIVVVRGKDEQLRAFFNVCRHRAGPAATDTGCRQSLQCAYHGWTYALTGELIGTPFFEGVEQFERSNFGLVPVQLETWEQFIFVNLDTKSPALHEFLGDLPQQIRKFDVSKMKFVERRDYLIDCNWKVYVDNYLEGYHLPMVHPGLMRELDFANYRTHTFRYHSVQEAPIRKDTGKAGTRRYRSDGTTDAFYFWVFPNLMVNINPETLSTNLIVPLSPEKTLTIFEWFAHDAESATAKQQMLDTIAFSDEIQQEDIAICEAVQRGLRSVSYDRGRYSVRHENGVHHFHRLWCEFLEEEATNPVR